eukprot:g11091.t1
MGVKESAEVAGVRPTSPPRLRHPRDPGSPETAYRKAVDAYLAPSVKSPYHVASNGGNGTTQSGIHRQSRSLSPTATQQSRWCSPIRPSTGPPSNGTGVRGSTFADPSSALSKKEGVPPLLLAPAEWGIGLGGEWVSARGPHTFRAVGRVSLTWADIRGNTLLHLAAQHNDIALVQERARVRIERDLKEATERKVSEKATALKTKDILRRIKEEIAEQEKTTADLVNDSTTAADDVGDFSNKAGSSEKETSSAEDGVLLEGESWLPLASREQATAAPGGSDGGSCFPPEGPDERRVRLTRRSKGAAVVEALRSVLEEANVRQVVRLAGLYLARTMNEAEWYHRTQVILPRTSSAGASADLLVDIAAAHPIDTYRHRVAKAAIQDFAEEERSNAEGGFWMDQGIKDALDLNARNRISETPLILGAQNASVEVVAALLEEEGTDIAAVNVDGCTALVIATMLNKTAVVKVLVAAHVARGLRVDHRTANGFSALHWAVVRGNADTTIDLVDAGAAVNTGRTERRQALWRLPIHKCAEYGSTACLQVLLKAGADPLVEDKLGMTPMHIAAGKGFLEILQILAAGGEHTAAVSVNVVSKANGKTPLHYAVESLQLEAARFILGHGSSGGDSEGDIDPASSSRPRDKEAEGVKLLDASQRTKLEMMLAAAMKEERGVLASSIASLSEFVQKTNKADDDDDNDGMSGDPHMKGLRGQRIDWPGVDGDWYSMVKDDDADLHINVRLTTPLPETFPDRQLMTSLSVMSEGHSLVIDVEDPYTIDTDGCPEDVSPCLANGGLRIVVDGQEVDELLRFSRQVPVADGTISLSASHLPVECRQFGGDGIWAHMYQEMLEGRRVLLAEESLEDWILRYDHMAAPGWCVKYIVENDLADLQSTHAIVRIETTIVTLRLNAGVNFLGDGEVDWDGSVLPDLEFWQMDVGLDGLDVDNPALSGLLGETARLMYD